MDVAFFDFENKNRTICNPNCTRFYQLVKEADNHPELQKAFRVWPDENRVMLVYYCTAGESHMLVAKHYPIVILSWFDTVSVMMDMKGFKIFLRMDKKNFSAREVFNRVEKFMPAADRAKNIMNKFLSGNEDSIKELSFDISNPMAISIKVLSHKADFTWTMSPVQIWTLESSDYSEAYNQMLRNNQRDCLNKLVFNFPTFHTYVRASSIWPTAENHIDYGPVDGLLRGYNVQVRRVSDGILYWRDAEFIEGSPEDVFKNEFHSWLQEIHEFEPTGGICFRGYGVEFYDSDEREHFVKPISDNEVKKILGII